MGSRKKSQVIGYRYFMSLVCVIGNPIDKILGFRFADKGKFISSNAQHSYDYSVSQEQFNFNIAQFFDNEDGGIKGQAVAYYGSATQNADPHYQQYLEKNNVPPLAFRNLSYVVFKDFYWGNSPYIKEVMFMATRVKTSTGKIRNSRWNPDFIKVFSWQHSDYYQLKKNDIESELTYTDKDNIEQNKINLNLNRNSWQNILGSATDKIFHAIFIVKAKKTGLLFLAFEGTGTQYLILESNQHLFDKIQQKNKCYIMYFMQENETITFNITIQGGKYSSNAFNIYQDIEIEESFYIKKHQEYFSNYADGANLTVNTAFYDLNTVHKIYEILTDDTAMNKPTSEINQENFRLMAKRIQDERLGMSWAVQDKSCKEALDELCHHIEAGIRVNRQTGLYEIILFRDDLVQQQLNTAIHFNESNIKQFSTEINNRDEMINTLNVKYYDRENLKMSSFSISDIGLLHTLGYENAKDIDFPYFMNRRNAEKVAHWKLKQLSTPVWKGSFTTGAYQARSLNRYDVIKLSWKNLGIENLPVRIMAINLGDGIDNTVTIDFIEVIQFSNINISAPYLDGPIQNNSEPKVAQAQLFEMPYLESVQQFNESMINLELKDDPDLSYLMVACKRPQANSKNALLYSHSGSQYDRTGYVSYCLTATLNQNIDYLTTSFNVKDVDSLSSIERGSIILIDDEFMIFQSYSSNTLYVKRGALDTQPQKHNADSILYFCDEYSGLDNTKYTNQETVKAKVLTLANGAMLDINQAPELQLKLQGRLYRPYPPANVRINGNYFPTTAQYQLSLTWNHRNRVLQTGGELLSWTDSSTILEDGTHYLIEVYQISKTEIETLLISENLNQATSFKLNQLKTKADTNKYRIQLYSVRDGFKCMYPFEYIVPLAFTAPFDVQVIKENGKNKLIWSVTGNNFTGFRVYRSTQSINIEQLPSALVSLNNSTLSYLDNTAQENQNYYYRIGVYYGNEMLLSDEVYIGA